MARLTGWQKAGVIAGVGCFSIVAIVAVGFAIAIVWARSTVAQYGDPAPTRVERSIPIGGDSAAAAPAPVPSDPAAPADVPSAPAPGASFDSAPLALTIELQEGVFTIEPGEPGTAVQVEGTFSPGMYELIESHDTAEDGTRRSRIRFAAKAPMWARVLSGMFGDGNDGRQQPQLTVRIPPGVPMDLDLNVAMGESRIDLGGLTLGEADLALSMGEHRLNFGTPTAVPVRRLRLDTRMGNVEVENLGNARPQSVESSASMGNLTADLGGAWPPKSDASLAFDTSMGQLTLRVPSDVKVEADFRERNNAPAARRPVGDNPDDPEAPLLKLRVESSMGEARVVRY